jgi:hypothetical protein
MQYLISANDWGFSNPVPLDCLNLKIEVPNMIYDNIYDMI